MQKISLIALVLVLVACSAPAPVIPTASSTSIPTSIPTLTETATPIPTETPTPIVMLTQSEWVKMTPAERMAKVPATTESGASNPTFLGENPVAFYFNQDGVLVDGVNGLTGESMDEQQVFEELLDLNHVTQKNSFEDGRYYVETTDNRRRFLGVPISREDNEFQLRQVQLDGKTYFLKGKDYISRDVKDGRVVSIFVAQGTLDDRMEVLFEDTYEFLNTEFGVAYEIDYPQKIFHQGWLSRPSSIPFRAVGYDGDPFEKMWDETPYQDGYEWPVDLAVYSSLIRPNDGIDW